MIKTALTVIAILATGYSAARTTEISDEWRLFNGCRQVAWVDSGPDANGMAFLTEGTVRWSCKGGRLLK